MSDSAFWTIFTVLVFVAVMLGIWIKSMWGPFHHRKRYEPRHRADRAYRRAYVRALPIKHVGRWRWGWPGDYRRWVRIQREARNLLSYSSNK